MEMERVNVYLSYLEGKIKSMLDLGFESRNDFFVSLSG